MSFRYVDARIVDSLRWSKKAPKAGDGRESSILTKGGIEVLTTLQAINHD